METKEKHVHTCSECDIAGEIEVYKRFYGGEWELKDTVFLLDAKEYLENDYNIRPCIRVTKVIYHPNDFDKDIIPIELRLFKLENKVLHYEMRIV
jgi:hypothetical protein